MFGFTTYAETPFSQANTFTGALVLLSTAGSTLTLNNFFNVTADANTNIGETSSSVFVNPFQSVSGTADVDISTVLLGSSIENISYGLSARTELSAINSSMTAQTLDISSNNYITISSIEVTLSENAFEDVFGAANTNIASVFAVPTNQGIDFSAKANTIIDSISADISTQLPDRPTGIHFDYQAIADQYSRSRTLYIIGQDLNRKAHIPSENYTVYIDKENVDYSVYIAPENFTIYIDRDRQDYTVYIAA